MKKEHEVDKAEWEEALKALQDTFNETENHVHDVEHNQSTVLEINSSPKKAAEALKKLEKQLQSLEVQILERVKQRVAKGTRVQSGINKAFALKK